jgi:putative ABC transport system permease protein
MLWQTIKLAITAIRRNALRSFLTLLGIIIGVGAVIAMVTVGNGATAKVTADLAKLGSNLLVLRPGQATMGMGGARSDARAFDERDVTAVRLQLGGIRSVAPTAARQMTVVHGSVNWNTRVSGGDEGYFSTLNWSFAAGRPFLDSEVRAGRMACVIGATVRDRLFGKRDPIGQHLRLMKVNCEVVGLLEAKGQSSFGNDQDDLVLIPLRAFQRRIAGNTDVQMIFISAADDTDTAKLQADAERLMRERRNITGAKEDDFNVRDMKQVVQTLTGTTTLLTGLLGAVAAVSLLVGGIGIMNIMLVSVTERTREIGIRLAIGALQRQVLLQFLVEAVVLSLFGGVVGIAVGLSLAGLATRWLGAPLLLDPWLIVIAFGFSAMIGIGFGYFPARRAAQLDPIEALRRE